MTGVHPHPVHECQKKGVAEFAICKWRERTRMRGVTGGGYAPEWEEYPRCFRSSGQEKMEDIKKFSRWLSLLSAGIITGTVAGLLAQREGASCRLYANKLNCHAIGGQTRPRALRIIKNSPGRFGAWSIHIVAMESEDDRRLYNSQALVPDVS